MGSEHTLEEQLAFALLESHPDEAARALETLPVVAAAGVLEDVSPEVLAGALRPMASHRAAELLAALPGAQGRAVVSLLGPELAAHVMRRMDAERRERLLESLAPDVARPLRTLLAFPEGTAGAIMDPHVLALPEDLTVADANLRIRQSPQGVRYNLYVVDRTQRLVGVLTLRELLLAEPHDRLGAIAKRDVLSIRAEADRRAVLVHPAWREAHSLPVVDGSGVYVGAVRYRTLRMLEQEFRKRSAGEVTTGQALGDLFWAGLAGAAGTIGAAVTRPAPASAGEDGAA